MAPLWGSLRIALQIAQDSTELFEAIVDMLTRVGRTLPQFRDYERLFSNHERLLVTISDAYLIIVTFCTDVKNLFKDAKSSKTSKVSLKLACKSLWKPFNETFHRYLKEFEDIKSRIESEAGQAHMIEANRERQLQEAHRAELVRLDEKAQLRNFLLKISPFDYKTHHRRMQALRHPGTASWLSDQTSYQIWLRSPTSSSFGLFGIPGSGKTIISSTMIDQLMPAKASDFLCYHYCTYDYHSSLSAAAILGTFLRQILEGPSRPNEVEEWLYETGPTELIYLCRENSFR